MISFTFLGKDSFIDFNVLLAKIPVIPTAGRRVSNIEIPGRDGTLTFDEGTYGDITVPLECSLKSDDFVNDAYKIKAWLTGGKGELKFSNDPSRKFYAQVVNKFDIAESIRTFGAFPVVFNCEPYKYSVDNAMITILSTTPKPVTINNPATAPSRPVIKVYGTGNITLTINGVAITLTGLTDNIIIDSSIEDAYNGGSMANMNNKMQGEFPLLKVGDNSLTWTGTVTKIEVTPNWRWI